MNKIGFSSFYLLSIKTKNYSMKNYNNKMADYVFHIFYSTFKT
ncbi:hypothetical protein SAMN05660206_10217 [Sphingobacterium wenxiniae]|uniref:Uncharacterized protein n=1 Tax=Sphingobacterium wenxiniae TaxID=683125 RepID=A0A1I6PXN5_9SPHI|nr:hypothetical protein SAMN05660206_10217 [Sphingobacterium wenxiniae]